MFNKFSLPPGRFSGTGEYILEECPGCQKDNHCYYNVESNRGWCHSCKLVIKSFNHLKKLCGDLLDVDDYITPWQDTSGPIFKFQKEYLPNAWDIPICRNTLIKRNVTEYEVRALNIMWMEEICSMVCLTEPISKELEEGVWYRAIQGWPNKWISRPFTKTKYYGIGQKFIPENKRNVLLVEGLYDIISPGFLGIAFTMFGTNMSDSWVRYIDKKKWIVNFWLDPDTAGKEASKKMKQKLYDWSLPVGRDFVEEGLVGEREPGDLDRWDRRVIYIKNLLREMV